MIRIVLERPALAALASLSVFVAACSRDPDRDGWVGTEEVLANGARRVQNAESGMWSPGEGWRLVETLRIGSVDGGGPDMFGEVLWLSLAVDRDGRMYVLDAQAHEVRVFDSSGVHVRTFGREGSGPGELRSPSLAGWGPDDNLWIADAGNARYSAYTPAGEYVTSVRRPIGFSMHPWPGAIDVEGRMLDIGIRAGEQQEYALVRVDLGTAAVDTFPLPSHDDQFHLLNRAGRPMRSVSIPFAGRLIWKPDPQGYVWSTITDSYRIVQQSVEGDTVLVVERAYQPVRVSREERDAAIDDLQDFIAAGGRVDASRIPSTKPVIGDFMVDDRGYLWVMPRRDGGFGRRAYDLFNPRGRYLGEVPAPTPLTMWPRPVLSGGHLYGFVLDDMHVPYLVRLRIQGRE